MLTLLLLLSYIPIIHICVLHMLYMYVIYSVFSKVFSQRRFTENHEKRNANPNVQLQSSLFSPKFSLLCSSVI